MDDQDLREQLLLRTTSNDSEGHSNDRFPGYFPEELNLLPIQTKRNLKRIRNKLGEMGFDPIVIINTLKKINYEWEYDRMLETALNEVLTLQLIASENAPLQHILPSSPHISLDINMRPRLSFDQQLDRPLLRSSSIFRTSNSSDNHHSFSEKRVLPIMKKNSSEEKKEEEEEKKVEYFECLICCNEIPSDKFTSIPNCEHRFCTECINDYLHNLIFSSQVLKINCPFENCASELKEDFIKKIISDDMFKKFKTFKQNHIINLDPNNRWCIRIGCDKYHKGSKEKPEIVCDCGQHYCFLCQSEWHPGKSCEDAVDEDFQKYVVSVKAKQCRFCNSRIEKNGGCNHMTCTHCKREFCWICLKQYNYKHYMWWNIRGCPGMQFTEGPTHNRYVYCFKHLIKKMFEIIGYFMLFLLLSPLVIMGFVLFVIWAPLIFYHKDTKGDDCSPKRIFLYIFLFSISPAVSPFSLILSPYLVCKIKDY